MPKLPGMNINPRFSQLLLQVAFAATGFAETTQRIAAIGDAHDAVQLLARSSQLSDTSQAATTVVLGAKQTLVVQIVAVCMASISITATLFALYWFCMMRRNYRRDLVLMLILGDLYKSLWYVIYGSVAVSRGSIEDGGAFCEVNGFMLQASLTSCDLAILFMSMHMALQIFPMPKTVFGYDGLYNVRFWVFAIWLVVPMMTASLAFVNKAGAYRTQGPWCWLPVRPFWYRLALSWIPRYLIWIFILTFAISIYLHVGSEFKVFGHERSRLSSADFSAALTMPGRMDDANDSQSHGINEKARVESVGTRGPGARLSVASTGPPPPRSLVTKGFRRPSAPVWKSPFNSSPVEGLPGFDGPQDGSDFRAGSFPIAPGIAAEDHEPASPVRAEQHQQSTASTASRTASTRGSQDGSVGLATIHEALSKGPAPTVRGNAADFALKHRRRAIQRQLRILFIYPVVYIMIWLIPFVQHCMVYSSYWATHPVFVLTLLSSMCQTLLGSADVSIFCWRERPWRHIPGSDGTVLGSFCFWRFCEAPRLPFLRSRLSREQQQQQQEQEQEQEQQQQQQQQDRSHAPDDRSGSESKAGLLAPSNRFSGAGTGSLGSIPATAAAGGARRPSVPPRMPSGNRTFSGRSDQRARELEAAHERLALERAEYQRHKADLGQRRGAQLEMPMAAPGGRDWFDSALHSDDGREGSERTADDSDRSPDDVV